MVYFVTAVIPIWLAAFLALWLGVAQAGGLFGKVIRVSDGDSITVLDSGNQLHKTGQRGSRLPRRGSPFGNKFRESLSSVVPRRQVTVTWHKRTGRGGFWGWSLLIAVTWGYSRSNGALRGATRLTKGEKSAPVRFILHKTPQNYQFAAHAHPNLCCSFHQQPSLGVPRRRARPCKGLIALRLHMHLLVLPRL